MSNSGKLQAVHGLPDSRVEQKLLEGEASPRAENAGQAEREAALLDADLSQLLERMPMADQYRDWLDSLQSSVSQCLEQVDLVKLVDEAAALLAQAHTQPGSATAGTELVMEGLLQLVNRLSISGDLDQQIEIVRSRLGKKVTQEALWQIQAEIRELASRMRERLEKEMDDIAVFLHHAILSLQGLQSSLRQVSFGQTEPLLGVQPDIDPLTGIANHVAFDKRMAHGFAHWKRYGTWLSLVIMEVDQFDQINATFGPGAGEKLLKALATVLNRQVRETDLLARYGKGEFVLLLPEASLTDAVGVADQLRQTVGACNFRHSKAPVPVTLSCGLAEFHPEDTPQSVFKRAKESLHLARTSGRNRCCREVELAVAAA